ncbi:MAG: FHA domain-containing protein [Clostridium sp.]
MNINGMQKLFLVNLKDNNRIEIPASGGIIGRTGDICPSYFMDNVYVSRKHARIEYSYGGYVICDLGSKNGTRVNGLTLDVGLNFPIRGGDLLEICDEKFEISYVGIIEKHRYI